MIIEGVTIHTFDKNQWVIHTPYGRNFLVNDATYRLFLVLQHNAEPMEVLEKFNREFDVTLTFEQFWIIVKEKLGGYKILDHDGVEEKPALQNQYLKLKVEVISSKWAGWLSKPLQMFYSPSVFWWSTLVVISIILAVYFSSTSVGLQSINYPLLLTLAYATMLVHELGHIGACASYGLKHGGIGFGFYFIMPVMYADITNVWLTDKQRRIIANLGGIFSELLYAAVLSVIYLFTDNNTFLMASMGISSFVIWQLNPFVRFDGYWILSDLTGMPNLLPKANAALKQFIKQPNALRHTNSKAIWLFIYGAINIGFFVMIMAYTLTMHWETVINFPMVVWKLFLKALKLELIWQDFNRTLITIVIFYTLLIRFLYGQYLKFNKANS
jgi:putative peptide zinc metalloprotease protein